PSSNGSSLSCNLKMNRAANVHALVVAPMRKEVVKKPKRRDLASISGFVEAEFVGLSKHAQAGVCVQSHDILYRALSGHPLHFAAARAEGKGPRERAGWHGEWWTSKSSGCVLW